MTYGIIDNKEVLHHKHTYNINLYSSSFACLAKQLIFTDRIDLYILGDSIEFISS